MHYLDNAATTAVYSQVADVIDKTMRENFANPSSLYGIAQNSQNILDRARGTMAQALGCKETEVFFTASGTEGSNIAVLGAARARLNWGDHIVASGYEHPAVAEPVKILEKEGFYVTWVKPDTNGIVNTSTIENAITSKTVLVAIMHANNEVGSLVDISLLAKKVKQKNSRCFFHSDGVQAFLKTEFSLTNTQIDSYAVSGHKIHAPKGVGALYLKNGKKAHIIPPFGGGGQEGGVRPGTENIPYIAGFAQAVQMGSANLPANLEKTRMLRNLLFEGIGNIERLHINSPQKNLAGIVNVSFPGVKSETLLHFLEDKGIYVSSGSACSAGSPSATLTAMGVNKEYLDSALRISFDSCNSKQDIAAVVSGLEAATKTNLRGIR